MAHTAATVDRSRICWLGVVLAPKAGKASDIEDEAFVALRKAVVTRIQARDGAGGFSSSCDEAVAGTARLSTHSAEGREDPEQILDRCSLGGSNSARRGAVGRPDAAKATRFSNGRRTTLEGSGRPPTMAYRLSMPGARMARNEPLTTGFGRSCGAQFPQTTSGDAK